MEALFRLLLPEQPVSLRQTDDPLEFESWINQADSTDHHRISADLSKRFISNFAKPIMVEMRKTLGEETVERLRRQHFVPIQQRYEHQLLSMALSATKLKPFLLAPHPHPSDLAWRATLESSELPLPTFLEDYFSALENMPLATFYTSNEILVLNWPYRAFFNALDRLHHKEHEALEIGQHKFYVWNGLKIPSRYITSKEEITRADIINEKNAERRRALLEILGHERFAHLLDLEAIDQSIDRQGNLQSLYRSREKDDLVGNHLYFASVVCPSTSRNYFLSVPPNLKTAQNAVAWTFGLDEKNYNPETET